MFGFQAFFIGGNIIACVHADGRIALKIMADEVQCQGNPFLQRKGVERFQPQGAPRPMKGWFILPIEAPDWEDFETEIETAAYAVAGLPPKKPKTRRQSPSQRAPSPKHAKRSS